MIFTTIDSDSDKALSKIGILGKSFEQIGTSTRQRKIEIDNLMGAMSKKDAKTKVGGFWSYIFGDKSLKEKPIDLSKFTELDEPKASDLLKNLQEIEIASKINTSAWQEYFSTLGTGQKWQIEFVKNNNLQKSSIEDLVKANQQARASALAHNEAIKAQTFSAKAGKAAFGAFRTVMSTFVMIGIFKGIELISKGIDNLVHSAEHCKELVDELMSSYQSALDEANNTAKTVESFASKYETLSKGVNNLGQNVALTTEEYAEYNDIVNQIADMFPHLIQGYTEEGNAILSLKGNVEQLRDAYFDMVFSYRKIIINVIIQKKFNMIF